VCPTGAITVDARGQIQLDHARYILCGDCVRAKPDRFAFGPGYETASRSRQRLVVGDVTDASIDELRQTLGARAAGLRRSIHVRHIDCGSDGSEEWEIQALWNRYYAVAMAALALAPLLAFAMDARVGRESAPTAPPPARFS
jgi:hypothetical protein